MTTFRTVQLDATEQHGTALIAADDSIWITVAPKWWDIATWLWWWLCPADRKSLVILTTSEDKRVATKAIRVARSSVRVRKLVHR